MVANEAQFTITVMQAFKAHIDAGKVRAIAVMSRTRSPLTPDVPSVVEGGYPEMVAGFATGIWAPMGTPADAVNKINRAVNAIAAIPEVKERVKPLVARTDRQHAGGVPPGGAGGDRLLCEGGEAGQLPTAVALHEPLRVVSPAALLGSLLNIIPAFAGMTDSVAVVKREGLTSLRIRLGVESGPRALLPHKRRRRRSPRARPRETPARRVT